MRIAGVNAATDSQEGGLAPAFRYDLKSGGKPAFLTASGCVENIKIAARPKIKGEIKDRSESGATLIAVMGMMVLFAIALLAAAPAIQHEVQREKELESIRRGEEVAEAIRQYIVFYNGQKLPESIDDLLEGLPQGTKKRQILRSSAATDPLSEDGKWRLIKPDPQVVAKFAKRVQEYNNGVLPANPSRLLDRYTVIIVNSINTETELEADDEDFDVVTDNQPFIGVASQSRSNSILAYYGIERHSNWVFTPLFRGNSSFGGGGGGGRNFDRRPPRITQ